jgi:FdhD protein
MVSPARIVRLEGLDGEKEEVLTDQIVREGRMLVYVNGKLLLDAPALPDASEAFTCGALFLDGLVAPEDMEHTAESIRVSHGGTRIDVNIPGVDAIRPVLENLDCFAGKTLLEGSADPFPLPGKGGFSVSAASIFRAVGALSHEPSLYRLTGGVHSAGFSDRDGVLLYHFEDISRRSAVDKIIGQSVRKGLSGGPGQVEGFLVSSGRLTTDIVVRAAKAHFPLIASVSAPTDRAIEIARLWGIALCGFVRGKRMNIYSHPERVIRGNNGS